MNLRYAAILLLVLAACGRTQLPEAGSTQTVSLVPPASVWSWHPLGGLAVVEGEVSEPTELVLEGHSIREHRLAEGGPVRWEFFRPPAGESAVLKTADGRVLARFEFSLPAEHPKATPVAPRLARRPEPAPAATPDPTSRSIPRPAAPKARAETRLKDLPVQANPGGQASRQPAEASLRRPFPPPAPLPEPPPPKTRTGAGLRYLPVGPIPGRTTAAMPSAAVPVEVPRRASTLVPVLVDPVVPRPVNPMPPPVSLTTPIPLTGTATPWPGMGEALNLTRGPGGQKRMMLSFDGGSSAEVATEVLDLLKARGVRTTLFLTGAFIQRYPALVKRMAAEGHELGNHTMNHPHFAPGMKRDPKWTRERVQRELLEADSALVRLLGRPMDPFWRAPYGEHTAEIRRWAEELGYRHVGWSEGADTLDWATSKDRRLYRTGEAIVQRLQQRLGRDGDGLIVLMHLGSARALGDRPTDGLGAFMDRARKEGWTFVSAGTILRDLGKPIWDPHQRLALLNGPLTR